MVFFLPKSIFYPFVLRKGESRWNLYPHRCRTHLSYALRSIIVRDQEKDGTIAEIVRTFMTAILDENTLIITIIFEVLLQ